MKGKKIMTENSKVVLRKLDTKYIDEYFEMINSLEVHEMTEPNTLFKPFSYEEIKDWLDCLEGKDNRKDFAIVLEDIETFVGEVVLNEIKDKCCNLRIALLPIFFNKGYGTQAIKLAIQYATNELNLERIELDVYNINQRGIRVYKKCGFEEVSKIKISDDLYEIRMSLEKV
ncbi:GNAT family N-acetyltransferase [Bacteriovorax sp. Seq25_V]|uniref:GNAT family N-acetyltransferase n=1 Tax=Bacteriovorax sp. Seq25_V TaxID=1201288 RepID=UPI0005549EE6|nr:GNAT family protein [Bacteriovorax sp. Seq25_V]